MRYTQYYCPLCGSRDSVIEVDEGEDRYLGWVIYCKCEYCLLYFVVEAVGDDLW